jgi:fluoroquinolone transport system ATP-binding protein
MKLQYGERAVRVEYRRDNDTTRADFPLDGLGDNAAFLRLLREHDVQTIHSREAELADIFIRVTGRQLT